jgi:hypothetical protein
LINDFPKYRKILTRLNWVNLGKSFGKGFILTALLGPIGFIGALIWEIISGENAEEIVENFANKYENYISEWKTLLNTIEKSIHPFLQNTTKLFIAETVNNNPFLQNTTKLFIAETVNNMDIIFDEFSNQNISLVPLNNVLLNQSLVTRIKNTY